MQIFSHSGALVLVGVVLASCGRFYFPPPNRTDYPCGYQGKLCADRGCCLQVEACGGEPGCPTGLCCYVGETRDDWSTTRRMTALITSPDAGQKDATNE